jgi:hypothetical protein
LIAVEDSSKVLGTKVADTKMPGLLKRVAGFVGSRALTPSLLAGKMKKKLPQKMPKKMAQKGLKVKVTPEFQKKNYVVFKLQVLQTNLEQLSKTALEEKAGLGNSPVPGWIKKFEKLVGEDRKTKLETQVVPEFVQSRMTQMMPEMIKGKLAEKKLKATPYVIKEADQEAFFQSKLRELGIAADDS